MSGKKTIVTLLRVSLLACPLLFTTPSFAMIDTPSVKVGFSPEGSASALVLDTINSAESSIRMMAYSFTDPDVMHALAKAKKRGVDVRIVVDDKGNTNRASQEAMKYINAYSALFDHGLASKSDQRFASIRSTGNLTFSTAF